MSGPGEQLPVVAGPPPEPWRLLRNGVPVIGFGGDYNPEQWPESVWTRDVELMREAGVNLVTVGVFGWASLQPSPDRFDFGWLDRVLDLLHRNEIAVDLATATASPPPWLAHRYPEILPVARDGTRLWPGSRQAFCPSSPIYRDHALTLATRVAERYAEHPALVLWHIGNEYGCHVAACFCDVSAADFRNWLRQRYGDLDTLNDAWGTTFWSQHYADWAEVLPPRATPTFANPMQQLDFRRFCSEALSALCVAERDVLRQRAPHVPATTNFMVNWTFRELDYWRWAPELDVISNDHYLHGEDPERHIELAFSADLTRSLGRNRPWILMENSSSAVNWQPRNLPKLPGEMRRNSFQQLAKGADAVLFFQWRQSRFGAEKYHSALLPHAGTDSRVWREVVELGRDLAAVAEIAGSSCRSEVAILFDWSAGWACELDAHPSSDLQYADRAQAIYRVLWECGVSVDFAHPEGDLAGYRLVIVPTLYAVTDAAAAALEEFVRAGGTALVTYFSGVVDERDQVRLGGYPGAFTELLGIRVQEFWPLARGQQVRLSDGSSADLWTEDLQLAGAESIASYADGPLAGVPAVTRHSHGAGTAWYLATRIDDPGLSGLITGVLADAGVAPVLEVPPGVEVVRRTGPTASYLIAINHSAADARLAVRGHELITGRSVAEQLLLAAGDVAVLRES